jgi:hypothetical protein
MVELDQPRLEPDRETARVGQRLRRLARAAHRGSEERVDALVLQPGGQARRLPAAGLGERRIGGAAVLVGDPDRQRMADDEQLQF